MTLTSAMNAFTEIGSPLWAKRANEELHRTRSGAAHGADLTPAEQRMAELAADGLSNKEIAAELFVSVKTVELTLSRVYRKLGIRSRSQLHGRLK